MTTKPRTFAELEADLEAAYRALEVARADHVPSNEMMIYHNRVFACQEALERSRQPTRDSSPDVIVE